MEKTSKKKMMITHQYPEKPEMIRIPWLKIFGTRSETTDLPVKKRTGCYVRKKRIIRDKNLNFPAASLCGGKVMKMVNVNYEEDGC